ncbi:MAG: lipase [Oscillospiraceae bacterium]|nr:lipase [Oscillospiraceae bacterium]
MTIVCYGDSNTYGYDPRGYFGGRYDAPWPELLGELTGWTVLNEGSCGRGIPLRETVFPGNADQVIVMLGTNDLLQGASAAQAGERMRSFLSGMDREKLLLLSPPPMVRGEWVNGQALIDASRQLEPVYRELADRLGIRFLDTGAWEIPMAYDGVHFTEEGHRRFAEQLMEELFHA